MEENIVQVNDIIQIELLDDPNSLPCQSRVEDIVDGLIVIAWPLERGVLMPIHLNRPLSLSFVRGNAGYVFAAIVKERGQEPIPYLKVCPLGPPERVQRRDFFRLDVAIAVELSGVIARSFNRDTVLYLKSKTIDLSGGGLSIRSEASIPVGSILEAKLTLADGLPPIKIMVRVVKSESIVNPEDKSLSHIGVVFTVIKESERVRIIRYLFGIQRNRIARLRRQASAELREG